MEPIIAQWQKGQYQPVYWLEGEEDYFLEVLGRCSEQIIPQEHKAFDEIIMYGRDITAAQVVLECAQAPMFGGRRLVLVREAQAMKGIADLKTYFQKPYPSAILVLIYKGKYGEKLSAFKKSVTTQGTFYAAKKLYANQAPAWVQHYLKQKQYHIEDKALFLLIAYLGTQLARLVNELEKLMIQVGERRLISVSDVATHTGISKEYNVFEIQQAFSYRDRAKIAAMFSYLIKNPKAIPLPFLVVSLYQHFIKIALCIENQGKSSAELAQMLGVLPFFVKDYMQAARLYTLKAAEEKILILCRYHLKNLGISVAAKTSDQALLKELLVALL